LANNHAANIPAYCACIGKEFWKKLINVETCSANPLSETKSKPSNETNAALPPNLKVTAPIDIMKIERRNELFPAVLSGFVFSVILLFRSTVNFLVAIGVKIALAMSLRLTQIESD